MKTSSPFSAPQVPPVTGASRKSMPRSAHRAASRRASSGETVLESMNRLPRFSASSAPCAPNITSSSAGGSLTMVISTSTCAASSRGFAASFAPSRTRSSAFDFVRFHTTSGNPAFSKLRPMGLPISPSPIRSHSGCHPGSFGSDIYNDGRSVLRPSATVCKLALLIWGKEMLALAKNLAPMATTVKGRRLGTHRHKRSIATSYEALDLRIRRGR